MKTKRNPVRPSVRLSTVLAELSVPEQKLISARYMEGNKLPSHAALGRRMGVSPRTIGRRLEKAVSHVLGKGSNAALNELMAFRGRKTAALGIDI